MRFSSFLVLFFFFTSGVSIAQEIVNIPSDFEMKTLGKTEIFYLQDESQTLTFENILQSEYQKQFKVIPKNSPNFGYSTDVYWLKIKVKKEVNNLDFNYFLELAYPTLDTICFYYQDKEKKWQKEVTGDRQAFSKRKIEYRHFIFPLIINTTADVQTIYLKIHSKGSILVPLILHSESSLRIRQFKQETFYGLFYGILMVMAVYNLFLFFSLRDTNYFLYFIGILLNVIAQGSLSGHTIQYLWGDSIFWANFSLIFFIYLGFAAMLLFSISFLEIKKYQRWLYYIILTVMCINLLLSLVAFLIDYNTSIKIMASMVILSAFLMLIAGLLSWLKGNQYARFFTLAWLIYILGVITMTLMNMGLLPDFFLTRHGVHIGSILEVTLLSFALADRINVYRKRTEEAQQIALEKSKENEKLVREQKDTLEQKVSERTQELNNANQELIVQGEELRQNMEELQATQDALEVQNKRVEEQNRQTQNSIKVAQTIQHAILPYQAKLDDLLEAYFIIYKPRDVVSGDFYWLNKINHKTVLVTMDCTGHGVPGAFMSLIGNTLLDKIIRVWEVMNPAEILSKLNEDIQIMLRQEETGNNSGMDMTIIIWEEFTNGQVKLEFAAAKQELFYIEPQAEEIKELKGDRKFIGGKIREHQTFSNHCLTLEKGTLLYLGSDGLEDQNDNKRKKFGRKRLKSLLLENSKLPLDSQKEIIENALQEHMQSTIQRDDILWMGIRL